MRAAALALPAAALAVALAGACGVADDGPTGTQGTTTTHAAGGASTSAPTGGAGGATTTTTTTTTSAGGAGACEEAVLAAWRDAPPALGLGPAAAAASYDAVIGKLMADYQVPGGAVAVVRDGRLVLARAYGFAARDAPTLAHPDSRFRLASVSKQVTSAAILVLVQEGKLSLDDHAFDVLGLAPLPGQTEKAALGAVTVRDLLHHAGGWNRDVEGDPMFQPSAIAAAAGVPSPPDCPTITRTMLARPTTYAPGTTYDYSNFGFCVLGELVEKASGQAFGDFVRDHVLAPTRADAIALGRTRLEDRGDDEVAYYDYAGAPLATSVFPGGGSVPWPYGGFALEPMAANGGFIASPVALLALQVGLDGRSGAPALLAPASLDALAANPDLPWGQADGSTQPASSQYWYGLGWMVNSAGNWWHTGSLPGTATEQVHAKSGLGWAALFNTRPKDADAFFTRLDQDLWKALDGAGDLGDADLFDQYAAPWSDWQSSADYQALFDAATKGGSWPVHVEGRSQGGAATFRARFAPFHGAAFAAHHDLDCATHVALAAEHAQGGYALVSLSSFVDAGGRRRFQSAWAK
jgi:CubicO group peptidase (beta-lactamase class C family)